MEFAYKLKELRLRAHMTQAELAKALFVSRTLVSKWESGDRHPSEDNIKRLCELFSVSREGLLGLPSKDAVATRDALGGSFVGYCVGLAVSLVALFCVYFLQRSHPWAGVGALMLSAAYVVPVGVALVWGIFRFRRSRARRRCELYSLLALLAVWLLSVAAYLYIF